VWLASLPLRHAEEEAAHEILRCFCTLLGGETAQAVLGAEGAWARARARAKPSPSPSPSLLP